MGSQYPRIANDIRPKHAARHSARRSTVVSTTECYKASRQDFSTCHQQLSTGRGPLHTPPSIGWSGLGLLPCSRSHLHPWVGRCSAPPARGPCSQHTCMHTFAQPANCHIRLCSRLPGRFHAATGRYLTVCSFLSSVHGVLAHKRGRAHTHTQSTPNGQNPDGRTLLAPMCVPCSRLRLSGAVATASSSMPWYEARLTSSATLAARSRSTANSEGVSPDTATNKRRTYNTLKQRW